MADFPGLRAEEEDVSELLSAGGTPEQPRDLAAAAPVFAAVAPAENQVLSNERESNRSTAQLSGSKSTRALAYISPLVESKYATPDGDAFLDINTADGVRRTIRVQSREMQRLIDDIFFTKEALAIGQQARTDVMATLEAQARHSGTVRDVCVRVAEADGAIYLDIGDSSWRAIRIDKAGWKVVSAAEVPVRFRRSRGMRALPHPERGAGVDALRDFIGAAGPEFTLVVGWLLCAFRARGPYPVLLVTGEHGSAKSTTARLLRRCLDPHVLSHRGPPRDEREAAIAAYNAHVFALDNVSHLPPWLSDCLCRIATGGGVGTRTLLTDTDETIISVSRPIIITCITNVATRGDLADRCFAVELPPIPESARKTERELDDEFDRVAPRILGALLDAVAYGLAHEADVHLARLPRMADATRWVVACEPACGWPTGTYLRALERKRDDMTIDAVEADEVAATLVRFMAAQTTPWRGTNAELLQALGPLRSRGVSDRNWPDSPRQLRANLDRVAPLLRRLGIEFQREPREPGSGRRVFTVRRAD
jgi:hypothetical protein